LKGLRKIIGRHKLKTHAATFGAGFLCSEYQEPLRAKLEDFVKEVRSAGEKKE